MVSYSLILCVQAAISCVYSLRNPEFFWFVAEQSYTMPLAGRVDYVAENYATRIHSGLLESSLIKNNLPKSVSVPYGQSGEFVQVAIVYNLPGLSGTEICIS
jgi:hypothetical protein